MIEYISTGSILDSDAQVLVCPVTLNGDCKAGLIWQMTMWKPEVKERFKVYSQYNHFRIGAVQAMILRESTTPKHPYQYVVFFPTQYHPSQPSNIVYIKEGMYSLANFLKFSPITSCAIPALGCGRGGLRWDMVEETIVSAVEEWRGDVMLYPPVPSPYPLSMGERLVLC